MDAIQDVLFEEISGRDGNIGLITLNRPKVLNALNHNMFNEMNYHLTEWEAAAQIKAVVIRAAEGRAFCAGGDIRSAYEKKLSNDPTLPYFFRDEYLLNVRIANYPKPYIAILDGITMGGGAGISINGSHRISTEHLSFAMPETGIGFYPDVGGSYFLSRLPFKIGFYLGLVGARITQGDCLALGLATHSVARDKLSDILYALADTSMSDNADLEVNEVIEKFSISAPSSELLEHKIAIETCFSKNSIEEIFHALEHYDDAWCQEILAILKTKSPTSLKVTLRALQAGAEVGFNDSMRTEYRLTTRFLGGKDFFEGIRAAIMDKDGAPRWQPATLQDVTVSDVEKYFLPLEQELI